MVFQRTYSLMDLLVDLNESKRIGSKKSGFYVCFFIV